MAKEVIPTTEGRAALGPYSPAVRANGFVFVAGQIGWDYTAGGLVEGGIGPEARQAMANLVGVLADAGLGPQDVVKTTVFLADMADGAAFNEAYSSVFGTDPPARSAFQVAALPAGARVEVEAIAADR